MSAATLPATPEGVLAGVAEHATELFDEHRSLASTPTALAQPLATSGEAANPLRQRVEACLLQRERTLQQLSAWLLMTYRVQENVGSVYDNGKADLRRWNRMSTLTRDDHRVKAAVLLAAFRVQTLELVEALDEWRSSRPPLKVRVGGGREVSMPRPFVWRGRWWPLQLCLDPPLLPLPLPLDPLLLRWFEKEDAGGSAHYWRKAHPDAAPPQLFAAAAWHPPQLLERMHKADRAIASELDTLELRAYELTRQRHTPPGEKGGAGASLQVHSRFGADRFLSSYASTWTSDGASVQLARLLYGGHRPYTLAVKALCKAVAESAAELARQNRAATILQSAARGRKQRLIGLPKPKAPKSQHGVKPQRHALRKEAGGKYAGITINFDASQHTDSESIQNGLRDALSKNASRVMDLFRMWDVDGNGTINKKEFKKAMRAIGLKDIAAAELDKLFDGFDLDGGGLLEAKELGKVLARGRGKEIQIADNLQVGAKGEIHAKVQQKHGLRKHQRDGERARSGIPATIANIKKAMAEDLLRTKDIMGALDKDQDGVVTKEEFHKVLPMMGFDSTSTADLDALFVSFDKDKGGTIDYEELHLLLRKTFEPTAEESEQDAAATKMQSIHRGRKQRKAMLIR